jgi:hypothetical protein
LCLHVLVLSCAAFLDQFFDCNPLRADAQSLRRQLTLPLDGLQPAATKRGIETRHGQQVSGGQCFALMRRGRVSRHGREFREEVLKNRPIGLGV